MAKQTEHGITWTDETWNPIRGCTRVSQGCVNCYAERVANRFNKPGLAYEGLIDHNGRWNGVIRVVEDHMLDPLKWKEPRRIFVNSMSDLFHENVADETIDRIFAVMALCPQHSFQVLTKRPARMAAYIDGRSEPGCDGMRGALVEGMAQHIYSQRNPKEDRDAISMWLAVPWPLPNVWLGVSVEDQKTADERIPLLLQTPAAVRWISAEPLLGPINLASRPSTKYKGAVQPGYLEPTLHANDEGGLYDTPPLDWVVVGGESGSGARPMDAAWARSLRDQCVEAKVAFHFKQWGEWLPAMCDGAGGIRSLTLNASDNPVRIGKRAAGRSLDGRTWDEYPETRS